MPTSRCSTLSGCWTPPPSTIPASTRSASPMCWSMARWRWMTTAAPVCWLGRRCRRDGHDQVGMARGNAPRTIVRVNDGEGPAWPASPSGGIDDHDSAEGLRPTRVQGPHLSRRSPAIPGRLGHAARVSGALPRDHRGARSRRPSVRGAERDWRARGRRREHEALEGWPPTLADRRPAHRHQGPARDEGHADPDGLRGVSRQLPQARQRSGVGAAAGRGGHRRQDGDRGARRIASGPHDESLRSVAHRRRLLVRFRRGRRRTNAARRHRHTGRRLHHPARRVLRQYRAQANPGRDQPRRAPGDQHEHARRACGLDRGRVAGRDRNRAPRRRRSRLPWALRSAGAAGRREAGRLIVLETEGWAALDAASREAFEALLEGLRRAGITLLRRRDHPWIEALEQGIVDGRAVCNAITGWENRWAMRNLVDQHPAGVSARAKATLEKAEAMTPEDYRAALMERTTAQLRHAAVARLADAIVTLSCPGPAPLWSGDVP